MLEHRIHQRAYQIHQTKGCRPTLINRTAVLTCCDYPFGPLVIHHILMAILRG
jgi:hypothetical protein